MGVDEDGANAFLEPAVSDDARREIRDLTLPELARVVAANGERSFRARQVMEWLWRHEAAAFEAMGPVTAALRNYLKDHFKIEAVPAAEVQRAADGTRKLLLRLSDSERIESVIIPTEGRITLCLSSQAGCAMACEFCATARMGLRRNLSPSEITGQVRAARRELEPNERLTNYVFMGMGEPLANYARLSAALAIMTADWGMGLSPRRITVSTVGLVPQMARLLAEHQVNLAVSLHATNDELRDRLAPINRRFPLAMLLKACAELPLAHRRRITFEYVMLDGVNDSAAEAGRLVEMLAPIRAKVNLIFFNPFPGAGFRPSGRSRVEDFQAILHRGNLTATIRESRGADIAAACGQLYSQRRREAAAVTGE
jgi:23S rRNA (adenine2503-C2)-methyltransferase